MGCKCQNLTGFENAMANAKRLTEQSGKEYVVFAIDFNHKKTVTYGTIATAKKLACCYYTLDGKEVKVSKEPKEKK